MKLSATIINENLVNLTSEKRINAIVVDDSFYGRLRSKNVELLANVNDHASKGNKYKRSFRILTMGWTNGNTFLPLSFNLQSSEKQENRYCEMKEGLNKNFIAYKRRKQATSKVPDVMIQMLEAAVKAAIPAKHVLFDSWFSYLVTIIKIFNLKLHTVGRLKNTTRIKYIFEGQKKTLTEIYKENRKRPGKSKYLSERLLYKNQLNYRILSYSYIKKPLYIKVFLGVFVMPSLSYVTKMLSKVK